MLSMMMKFAQNIDINVLECFFKMSTNSTNNNGIKAIAFFQFILTLMTDLNPKEESDKKILDDLIKCLLNVPSFFNNPPPPPSRLIIKDHFFTI